MGIALSRIELARIAGQPIFNSIQTCRDQQRSLDFLAIELVGLLGYRVDLPHTPEEGAHQNQNLQGYRRLL